MQVYNMKMTFRAPLFLSLLLLSGAGGTCLAQSTEPLPPPFHEKATSKHFTIYSVNGKDLGRTYCDYLEDFLGCVNNHFGKIPPNWNLTINLYPDKKALNEAEAKMGSKANVTGYVQKYNTIFAYNDCGIGTLSHEMMHKVTYENFKTLDQWAKEGIPCFFEKIYGYKTPIGTVLYLGYQNPWRLKELSSGITKLTIKDILTQRSAPTLESNQRLLATFLAYEGKLEQYFYMAQNEKPKKFKTLVEETFQEPLEKLEPRFQQFVQKIKANEAMLITLPDSKYFQTKNEFDALAKANKKAFETQPLPASYDMKYTSAPDSLVKQYYVDADKAFKANKYQECLAAIDKFLAIFPKDLTQLNMRITCYEELKNPKAAYAVLAEALRIDPNSGEAYTSRGILNTHQGKLDEALKDFEKAYQADTTNAALNMNLGEALIGVHQFKKAIPYLDVAAKKKPDDGEPFYYRAVALKNTGKTKESDADLKMALKLHYEPGSDSFYDPRTHTVLMVGQIKKK
jgi:tetratricopeptide (TPR) repeat protein